MRDKLIARIRERQEETMFFIYEELEELSNDELMDILEELAVEKHEQEHNED